MKRRPALTAELSVVGIVLLAFWAGLHRLVFITFHRCRLKA